jgi:hypothetical protein
MGFRQIIRIIKIQLFIKIKKTGTEKLLRSGILLHKKKLFLLVTQQFELLLALVLGDLLTPFFLQVTHFFTFLHYTVY